MVCNAVITTCFGVGIRGVVESLFSFRFKDVCLAYGSNNDLTLTFEPGYTYTYGMYSKEEYSSYSTCIWYGVHLEDLLAQWWGRD